MNKIARALPGNIIQYEAFITVFEAQLIACINGGVLESASDFYRYASAHHAMWGQMMLKMVEENADDKEIVNEYEQLIQKQILEFEHFFGTKIKNMSGICKAQREDLN